MGLRAHNALLLGFGYHFILQLLTHYSLLHALDFTIHYALDFTTHYYINLHLRTGFYNTHLQLHLTISSNTHARNFI